MVRALAAALLVAALPAIGQAGTVADVLTRATVRLASGCTGVLVEEGQLVATAYHCVDDGRQNVEVRLADGSTHTAWVVGTDPVADQAVLFIAEPVRLRPLQVLRARPVPGSVLFFAGHPDRLRVREARLDRLGACPSLPGLSDALFTTIDGVPGDSGAALVDGAGRIAGLVHGGAQCRIATPARTLGALVDDVLAPEP